MNVRKAFFCHASEDKPLVEAVYQRVLADSPDLAPWLDKYEILAGESLIERIAAGMDKADKFVIFLSSVSITKRWVNRELRRAIMREITGIDPNFIIPVLIGDIAAVPAFLEDKKYIPLYRVTEKEWLLDLTAAIRGERPMSADGATAIENVIARIETVLGQPHIARVIFEARMWPADVGFSVTTSEDYARAYSNWPAAHRGVVMHNAAEANTGRTVALNCEQPKIRPGFPLVFVLEFAPGVDAKSAIEEVAQWDPS